MSGGRVVYAELRQGAAQLERHAQVHERAEQYAAAHQHWMSAANAWTLLGEPEGYRRAAMNFRRAAATCDRLADIADGEAVALERKA